MTLQEINALTLQDVKSTIQHRVFNKKDPLPQYDEDYDDEFEIWYDTQFTNEELEAELILYKAELTAIEQERLRKENLRNRFESLMDMRMAYHALYPDQPNPALFLKNLCCQEDHADAESKMQQLESKDYELQNTQEVTKKNWEMNLKKDLAENNITMDGLLEALVKKVILNDFTQADALKEKLEEINERNPRP